MRCSSRINPDIADIFFFYLCHIVIHVLRACLSFRPVYICFLTTFSSFFSVQRGGRVEIIANDQGHRITPSWVAFTDEERLYVLPFFFLPLLSTLCLPRHQDR